MQGVLVRDHLKKKKEPKPKTTTKQKIIFRKNSSPTLNEVCVYLSKCVLPIPSSDI